jgi:hypothetical protein
MTINPMTTTETVAAVLAEMRHRKIDDDRPGLWAKQSDWADRIASAMPQCEPVAWRDDVQTVVNWIFGTVGKIENVQLLTDDVVKATRRLESNLAAHPAQPAAVPVAGPRDDLLAALVRATAAESALRRLADEWENDHVRGWEDRMNQCIAEANALLASQPTAPPAPVSVPEGLRPAGFNESAHVTVMTYARQPGNVEAWRLGEARANSKPGGDYIDGGLSLLKELHCRGYGVVRVDALPTNPSQTKDDRHDD